MLSPDLASLILLQFCDAIAAGSAPICVGVNARKALEPLNCYNNVDTVIAQEGGKAIVGWHLTEWPGLFMEAEPHAVWMRPDGELEDPTPHQQGHRSIVFLRDPTINPWNPRPNERCFQNTSPVLRQFIDAQWDLRRAVERQSGDASRLKKRAERLRHALEMRFGTEPLPCTK